MLWEHSKGHFTSGTAGIMDNFLKEVMSVLRFEGCGRKRAKVMAFSRTTSIWGDIDCGKEANNQRPCVVGQRVQTVS